MLSERGIHDSLVAGDITMEKISFGVIWVRMWKCWSQERLRCELRDLVMPEHDKGSLVGMD